LEKCPNLNSAVFKQPSGLIFKNGLRHCGSLCALIRNGFHASVRHVWHRELSDVPKAWAQAPATFI